MYEDIQMDRKYNKNNNNNMFLCQQHNSLKQITYIYQLYINQLYNISIQRMTHLVTLSISRHYTLQFIFDNCQTSKRRILQKFVPGNSYTSYSRLKVPECHLPAHPKVNPLLPHPRHYLVPDGPAGAVHSTQGTIAPTTTSTTLTVIGTTAPATTTLSY